MIKKLNILVTGCGGDIGQSIGKILLKADFTNKLFGIDISDKNAAQFIYPNFCLGLPVTDSGYLKSLEKFIEVNAIDIIIPIAEPELRFFLSKNILNNIGSAKMITASTLALEVGFDKFKTAEFLKKEGLPYPKTFLVNSLKSINSFPVILKSRTGSGSKDVHKINSQEEFLFYTKKNKENYIIQDYISGDLGEFTCGVFRSSNKQIITQIFKRELSRGYSGYGEIMYNRIITSLLEKIAIKLDLLGSINVQLRISENSPKIFEINPRFSSTVLFRHLFGFKDLEWSIKDRLGEDLIVYKDPKPGSKFYKGFNEYINI